MSTELIGNCGYTVGERGYFERINKAFGLSEVINFSVGYDYYNGIKNFCDKLSSIISEVYSDVRNNAKIMSFLDERDREETINIVEGLNEVCKMWARSCSDADRAKSILSLSASETRLATVYKGNIIKNLIMDCQSYTKYRPNETTGGIFVSWRRKEELPTGA